MITGITGTLTRVLDDEVRLRVAALEYQVLVPEFVRRELQTRQGHDVSLYTFHFLEGNSVGSRFVPRLVGFENESDLEFFDLFCTVEKIGVRKALKAMARAVSEIAGAILREDSKWLTTLPGVGKATADQIVAALKRKVTRFTVALPTAATQADGTMVNGRLLEEVYEALMAVGHNPTDARHKLDLLIAGGEPFATVQDAINLVYKQK